VLFLNTDGTVKSHRKIDAHEGGFTGELAIADFLGQSNAALGDLDGDGVQDLFVGSVGHESDFPGGPVTGTIWVLFLNTDGTVKSHRKIDAHEGGFTGELAIADFFGQSIAALGDLDGDGIGDVVTGAIGDDDGGPDKGAVWFLYPYGPRWSEAGPGTAGGAGVPKLSVSSSLAAGAPLVMRLEKSVANAPLLLFVSVAGLPLPLKGGTLWPSLSAPHAAVALWTGASGKIQIPTIVPPGWPAGLELWMQAWIKDAAGAGGFASTNAIIGTAP
jgi:hypothetical protein